MKTFIITMEYHHKSLQIGEWNKKENEAFIEKLNIFILLPV